MKAFLGIVLILASTQVSGQEDYGIHFENASWSAIVAKAKAENKLIFIDAYTTWCGPCKMMDQQVYPTPKVGSYFNEHFINAKFDMEKGEGKDLASRYGVRVFPTYLFINPDEQLVHRLVGFTPSDQFIEHASHTLDPDKQFYTLLKKYEADKRNTSMTENLIWSAIEANETETAQKIAPEYFKSQSNWLTEKNLTLIDRITLTSNDPYFKFMLEHKDEFGEQFSPAYYKEKMFWITYKGAHQKLELPTTITKEIANKNIPKAEKYFKAIYPEQQTKLIHQFKVDVFQASKDWNAYAREVISNEPDQPLTASELNHMAWIFFEHIDDPEFLKKAVEWAQKSIELDYSPYNLDTIAHLYFKLKNKPKAKLYANKSIEVAKLRGSDYSSTQSLLDEILGLK